MKIAFFDTKPYDKIWFEPMAKQEGFEIIFFEEKFNANTAVMSKGCDAVCIFVNDKADEKALEIIKELGVKGVLLRCAGFNNVDIKTAKKLDIPVLRVPSYSPRAVAEYALGLLLAVNRNIHRAYVRTRDFNYSINGLMGMDLSGKTIGIIGTGKIGQAFMSLIKGFDMEVLLYDPYPIKGIVDGDKDALMQFGPNVKYVDLDTLFCKADAISIHCPLTKDTYHIINKESINKMKKGVLLVNTSRGALIDTGDLIEGLRNDIIGGIGLDVYEEEDGVFFEDMSNVNIKDMDLLSLTSFRNVIITSHQAFFTKEAMSEIARISIENAKSLETGSNLKNLVLE